MFPQKLVSIFDRKKKRRKKFIYFFRSIMCLFGKLKYMFENLIQNMYMFENSKQISVLQNRHSVLPNKESVSTKQSQTEHLTGPWYIFALVFIWLCLNPEVA